jgi:hypothetical protein
MKGCMVPGRIACALAVLLLAGCSDKTKDDVTQERLQQMAGGTLVETVPVRGTVTVDGAPAAGVNISLYKENARQPFNTAQTDKEGKYCWSTNQACDGVEVGTFTVTFTYIPKAKKNDDGVDVLRGKYANPATSKFKLTVEAGKPQETVNYELVTK